MDLFALAVKLKAEGEADVMKALADVKSEVVATGNELKNFGNETAKADKGTESLGAALTGLAGALAAGGIAVLFHEASQELDQATNAMLRLRGAANLTGAPLEMLEELAQKANKQFFLGDERAAKYAESIARITGKAGELGKSQEFLAKFLDLTAARGLDAEQSMDALRSVVFDLQRGERALFSSDVADRYEKIARQSNRTADQLTEQEKAQVRVNMVMEDGSRAAGKYAEWLDTVQGREFQAHSQASNLRGRIGALLEPIRAVTAALKNELLPKIGDLTLSIGVGAGGAIGLIGAASAAIVLINELAKAIKAVSVVMALSIPTLGLWAAGIAAAGAAIVYFMSGQKVAHNEVEQMEIQLDKAEKKLRNFKNLQSSPNLAFFQYGQGYKEQVDAGVNAAQLEVNTLRMLIDTRKAAAKQEREDTEKGIRLAREEADATAKRMAAEGNEQKRKDILEAQQTRINQLIALREAGQASAQQTAELRGIQQSFAESVHRGNMRLDEQVMKMQALKQISETFGKTPLAEPVSQGKVDFSPLENRVGPKLPPIGLTPADYQKMERELRESLRNIEIPPMSELPLFIQLGINFRDQLRDTLIESFAAGIEAGVQGGVGKGFKALTGALLRGLGHAMIAFGAASLKASTLMQAIMSSLASLLPGGAIAASIAMIAIGAALSGAASGAFGSGGGGGGSGSSSAYGTTATGSGSITRLVFGASSAASAAGLTPVQPNNVWIIGTNDPRAQRQVQELLDKGMRRGGNT